MNLKPSTIYGEWVKEETIKEIFKNIKRIANSNKSDLLKMEDVLSLEEELLNV